MEEFKQKLNLSLTAKDIYLKKFDGNKAGYDALQVDQFLDLVIKDYQEIEHFIAEKLDSLFKLGQENVDLKNKLNKLEDEHEKLKEKLLYSGIDSEQNLNNIDYLKRISQLENILYQNGINPNNIK